MTLNRDKARTVLLGGTTAPVAGDVEAWLGPLLDRLEGCVEPDPRLARIAELVRRLRAAGHAAPILDGVEAILTEAA